MNWITDWNIDKTWTLFLDRDGVLNRKIDAGYVLHWNEFEFMDGVMDIMPLFRKTFGKIVVVTNQQGIGKGLMPEEDLLDIFEKMQEAFLKIGVEVDCYYYCPHLQSQQCRCRKPNAGMGYQAQADFPEIVFEKSVMIGDSISDMQFGRKLGTKTILLTNGRPTPKNKNLIDLRYLNLQEMKQRFDD